MNFTVLGDKYIKSLHNYINIKLTARISKIILSL